jgi:pimeloyl-ACP methyl ester carboxylesterase
MYGRSGISGLALALLAATAVHAAPGELTDPLDLPPLTYCEEGLDGGALGVPTEAMHDPGAEAVPPAGVTRTRMEIGGVGTRVLQAGPPDAEEAVLFVHGNPGSGDDWRALLPAAGRIGRAVALDMPGFGRADDGAGLAYSPAAFADFIDAATRSLGIERVHLVLHDFGGPYGLEWAARRRERVASVVLLNTGVLLRYRGHPAAHVWRTHGLGELTMLATTRRSFRALLRNGGPRPVPRAEADRMFDDFDRGTRCAVLRLYRSVDDPDGLGRAQAQALRPLDIPALVIWGRHDPYLPVALAERQRQAFPSARIRIFEQSGHWPFLDDPLRTEAEVLGFLAEQVRAP